MEIRCLTDKEVYRDDRLVKRLRFLTNGGWGRHPVGSGMIEDLRCQRPGHYLLAIDDSTKEVIGWALVVKRYYQPSLCYSVTTGSPDARRKTQWQVGVYVTATQRCLGLGRKLAVKAKQIVETKEKGVLVCVPWTLQGRRMYEHAGIQVVDSWN